MSYFQEKSGWEPVKEMMGNRKILLGQFLSYQFTKTPRRVLYSMSYYKFAAKIIGSGKRVLDVGCGEGLGTWLLALECGKAKGIDMDSDAIKIAKKNSISSKISFKCENFLTTDTKKRKWDAIVIFDVIEHILPMNMSRFFQKVTSCLNSSGVIIIGTPNITSHQYASEITKVGHVNIYSADRLEEELRQYFSHVFIFGANDEIIHTGFLPMAQYLIAISCGKCKGLL